MEFNKKIENKARDPATAIYKSKGLNNKPNIWICGNKRKLLTSKSTRCSICKRICYYDTKAEEFMDKKHKKICPDCAIANYEDDMSEIERKIIMEKVI